ncbi:MAG: hypothetical protein AAGE52_30150 [Myxococcota bacterium]
MTRPPARGSSRGSLSRLALGGATVLSFLAAVLVPMCQGVQEGQGFRRTVGARCGEGNPREAAEPHELAPVSGCVRWTAFLALDRRRSMDFVLESAGGGAKLSLDGDVVVRDPRAHPRREREGRRTLERGVYEVVVDVEGARYLRLFERDRTGPHNQWIPAALDRHRYYRTQEHAEAALNAGHSSQPETITASLLFASFLGLAFVLLAAFVRREGFQPADLALGALVAASAVAVRLYALASQDVLWDELAYLLSGEHMARNAVLGDWSKEAFRFNFEHPPVAKWIYGLGSWMGGHSGARALGACLQGAAAACVFSLGRVLFGSRLGACTAGLIVVFLPHLVGHGRLSGLESPVLAFCFAATLTVALWARSVARGSPRHSLAMLAAFWAVLGMGSRMTAIWTLVLVFLVGAGVYHRRLRRGVASVPLAMGVGTLLGLMALFALWPWLWDAPVDAFKGVVSRWGTQHPTEYYLGHNQRPPPAGFYAHAFVATTPVSVLGLGLLGAALGLATRRLRAGTLLVIAAFVLPFTQSISSFRQDLARYVVQAWPALALLASLPLVVLEERLATLELRRAVPALAAVGLVAHVGVSLALVEPYPLDYFNDASGGPYEVFRSRRFEMAWWGEGIGEAIATVNEVAPEGATVRLRVDPIDTHPPLREDLRETGGDADFVVANHYKYRLEWPPGCDRVKRVTVRGAPLVEVFSCPRDE